MLVLLSGMLTIPHFHVNTGESSDNQGRKMVSNKHGTISGMPDGRKREHGPIHVTLGRG